MGPMGPMGPMGLEVEPDCCESAMFRNGSDAFFPRCFLRKISLYLMTSSSLTTQEVKALGRLLHSGLRGMFTYSPWRQFARGSESFAACQNISSLILKASTYFILFCICFFFYMFSCAQQLDICTSLHIFAHLSTGYCIGHCSGPTFPLAKFRSKFWVVEHGWTWTMKHFSNGETRWFFQILVVVTVEQWVQFAAPGACAGSGSPLPGPECSSLSKTCKTIYVFF